MDFSLSVSEQDPFVGNSEMALMMRQHDWGQTPLGPPSEWPQALKVALRLLLTSKFEMWLGWGPQIAFFYNDAYRPTLGNKHPHALGMPTQVLWEEIWDDIKDRLSTVYETGQATWDRALLLLLERDGYAEETYHTFSYSPLLGDDGRVDGVFCAVTEETERIVSERRMGTMRALASGLAAAGTKAEVLAASSAALDGNLKDLPFSALYLFDNHGTAHREWVCGANSSHPLLPRTITSSDPLWNFQSIEDSQGLGLRDLTGLKDIPTGYWQREPKQAAAITLKGQGAGELKGVLIAGLNPHRSCAEEYLDFLKLIAGQISSRLASAEAFETEKQRAATLIEAGALRDRAAAVLEQLNRQLSNEVEIRTAESARLRTLFQQAPSFMCILNGPDHVFDLVNDAYRQLVGHRHLEGLPVKEALPEVAGQGFLELLDRVYVTGKPYVGTNVQVQLQREGASRTEERYLNFVYQPIVNDSGSVTGIFVDGFDVTHQKRAEEQLRALNQMLETRVAERTHELQKAYQRLEEETHEREVAQIALRQAQKMEALGNLTGGVAHDFNNLLQVVGGNLQLLAKDVEGDERAAKRLRNALSGVARGAKLASQLLAFGRRQPLEPKVVNVRRLIHNMDDMLRRALGEEIELESIVSGGLWNALIDPNQLENAILNLVINARDAMGGRGRLTIEASNSVLDDDYARLNDDVIAGNYVMVAVTDTGAGIPPDLLEQVLEPFFTTKSDGKGSGLGLSMVYGFLKQSGGHLKIYSEVGHGTTMRLYMPRTTQVEDNLTDLSAYPIKGGDETILVAEDDDGVRETSVALLTDLGYRVLKAQDAQSAFAIISSGVHIDMLFTDVVMPGPMRSTELVAQTKSLFPHIAVLYTSGYTENSIVHGGKLDPGVELLSKPYAREALARKVRHVLNNAQQQRLAAEHLSRSHAGGSSQGETSTDPKSADQRQQSRILIVEDEPLILMATADMVEELGHSVDEANSAEQALQLLERKQVDVLLTDVGLPGMQGTELARVVRSRWPEVKIIFASGDSAAKISSGITDALQLPKPFSLDELEACLTRALD